SSAFLGSLYGVTIDLENTKAYIQAWAGKEHIAFKVVEAVGRVEKIYHYIEENITKPNKEKIMKNQSKPQREVSKSTISPALPFKTKDFENRSQVWSPKIQKWIKRDDKSGLFISVKTDGKPYSRVKKTLIKNLAVARDLPPAA
ncbi:MAG: hypothetical protein ACRC5H_06255, partial [Treponemataceae bacterium]